MNRDEKVNKMIEEDKKIIDEFLKSCDKFEELTTDSTILWKYIEQRAEGRVIIRKIESDENDSHLKPEVTIWIPKWW